MNSRFIILSLGLLITSCSSIINTKCAKFFHDREGSFSVTVYPVHIILAQKEIQADFDLAQTIIDSLNRRGIAEAIASNSDVNIPVEWIANQAKMFKTSGAAFAELVSGANLETDYALLVEVLCNSNENLVRGVHLYLANGQGIICEGGLSNSHWENFTSVGPHDRYGGIEVALNMLHWFDPREKK